MLLAAVLLAALTGAVGASAAAPQPLTVDGLSEPVDVLRDRWGINHIYAKNEHDLFFAQGYSAARDRLFQLELWRRQATGTVSEASRISIPFTSPTSSDSGLGTVNLETPTVTQRSTPAATIPIHIACSKELRKKSSSIAE